MTAIFNFLIFLDLDSDAVVSGKLLSARFNYKCGDANVIEWLNLFHTILSELEFFLFSGENQIFIIQT